MESNTRGYGLMKDCVPTGQARYRKIIRNTSKYMPHQGKQERERRLKNGQ